MLDVEQASASRAGKRWSVRWRIRNPDLQPLAISSAWLPHSRFRSEEWRLEPPLIVPAGGEVLLDSTVAWSEDPVVENGFLILRLEFGRAFARLRISAGPDGSPNAVCEAVTLQPG